MIFFFFQNAPLIYINRSKQLKESRYVKNAISDDPRTVIIIICVYVLITIQQDNYDNCENKKIGISGIIKFLAL